MTIRRDIITRSPFFKLIAKRFSDFETDLDALAYAIEGQFRGTPSMGAIDGFNTFHVVEETDAKLRVVGMAYFLPSALVPIDTSFSAANDRIAYRAILGAEDDRWKRLTEKKRWSAVYLYATENHEPQWNWEPPLEGFLWNRKASQGLRYVRSPPCQALLPLRPLVTFLLCKSGDISNWLQH